MLCLLSRSLNNSVCNETLFKRKLLTPHSSSGRWVQVVFWILAIGCALGAAGGWYVTREIEEVEVVVDGEGEKEEGDEAGS